MFWLVFQSPGSLCAGFPGLLCRYGSSHNLVIGCLSSRLHQEVGQAVSLILRLSMSMLMSSTNV